MTVFSAAPGAPGLTVWYLEAQELYRVLHTPSGGSVDVPERAVRDRVAERGVKFTWRAQRRAAIELAAEFAQRVADGRAGARQTSALSRRLQATANRLPRR